MSKSKQYVSYSLYDNQHDWIKEMTERYEIVDSDKALRIMINYINQEADLDTVFKKIRCLGCSR